eukprot:4650362-Prymnesium_polylepis.1
MRWNARVVLLLPVWFYNCRGFHPDHEACPRPVRLYQEGTTSTRPKDHRHRTATTAANRPKRHRCPM